jgi:uncharacterized UPF0160 family protein
MNQQKQLRTVGTHNGSFHADEVTACALLVVAGLVDQDKIIRTRDLEKLKTCEFVCDVGGIYDPNLRLFDHHQADYTGPMSSAGMILLYLYSIQLLAESEYNLLNHSLILGVDAHDNGVELHSPGVCTYSQLISNFSPIPYDATSEMQDTAFHEALNFAIGHLKRLLERHRYIHSFKRIVQEAMNEGKSCLIFDQAIPWMDCFFELEGEKHPALFVIMPSGNNWKLRGIPPNSKERMKVRCSLPEAWAGLLDEDLQRVSGLPGGIFCHKGRFFSLWKTLEDAKLAFEKVAGTPL